MKKFMMCILVAVFAAGCGQSDTSSDTDQAVEQADQTEETAQVEASQADDQDAENDEGIKVDKNLLSVEMTLPASFLELADMDIDQLIAEAKQDGVEDVTKNDDGSLTYKMSKSTHRDMMQDMEEGVIATIDEMQSSEDYPSIIDIKANRSYSEFTMIVDREVFENSFDGFAVLGLAFSGMFYQVFDGVDPNDYEVMVHLEDETSGEAFDTIVYPDALED